MLTLKSTLQLKAKRKWLAGEEQKKICRKKVYIMAQNDKRWS